VGSGAWSDPFRILIVVFHYDVNARRSATRETMPAIALFAVESSRSLYIICSLVCRWSLQLSRLGDRRRRAAPIVCISVLSTASSSRPVTNGAATSYSTPRRERADGGEYYERSYTDGDQLRGLRDGSTGPRVPAFKGGHAIVFVGYRLRRRREFVNGRRIQTSAATRSSTND